MQRLLVSPMSRCTRPSDSFLKRPREWGWWSQRSGTGVGGRAGERRGNGLPDGFHFSFWPKASPGCSPIGKAGLDWAWVGTHGLRASGGSSRVGAPHPNQEVLGDTGEGAVLDVWAGRVGWTRELDAGARRRFLAASLGLSSTAETVRKRSARPLSILRGASGLVLTGSRPVSPAGRLGRVRRWTGPRLLPGRPVHQPGGLLHLPLPDGQGRQPRPSRPGLCWCVPNPPPLRLWALLPPGAWGRGRGRLLRPVRWTQRGGPPHTIRPTKWFHFNFF